MFWFDIRSGIKHFLHTGATFRPFVGNHDDIATHHLSAQDALASSILWIKHLGRARKFPNTFVHSGCFYHTTVLSDISLQYGQPAVLAVGMFQVADTTIGTVGVEFFVRCILRTQRNIKFIARGTRVDTFSISIWLVYSHTVFSDSICQCHTIHTVHICFQQTALGQLT